jgi:hypothetical protein
MLIVEKDFFYIASRSYWQSHTQKDVVSFINMGDNVGSQYRHEICNELSLFLSI